MDRFRKSIIFVLCVINSSHQDEMVKNGDLNLGALFPLTNLEHDSLCGESLFAPFIVHMAEAQVYTIGQINERGDILPNITLGYVVLDSCAKETSTIAKSLQLVPLTREGGADICQAPTASNGYDVCDSTDKNISYFEVTALVGPLFSSNVFVSAPLLSLFNIPIISPVASSDELSNKDKYANFMRTVNADADVANTMVSLVEYYGWSYISVVYLGDAYGQSGIREIRGATQKSGICIATSIVIDKGAPEEFYDNVLLRLRKLSDARIVLAYVTSPEIDGIVKAIERSGKPNEFIWIFDNSALSSVASLRTVDGAFVTSLTLNTVPEFENYYQELNPANNEDNPWFKRVWEMYFGCTWKDINENDTTSEPCNATASLKDAPNYEPNAFASVTVDAVLTLAYGLHDYIAAECPKAFNGAKDTLKECIDGRKLIEYAKKVSFNGTRGLVEFDENGDILARISIYHLIRTHDDKMTFQKIGFKDTKYDELSINNSAVEWIIQDGRHDTNISDHAQTVYSAPTSICSLPCENGEITLKRELPCCWDCFSCRENEITDTNGTKCIQCPPYEWPEQIERMTCDIIEPTYLQWDDPLKISLATISLAGLLMTSIVGGTFVKYRNEKLIKASSKHLTLIIFIGVVLEYLTVFTITAKPDAISCALSRIGFGISFTLVYAPLLTKTFRVYRIFESGKGGNTRPRFVSNQAMLTMVLFLILIQVIIVIVTFTLEPPEALKNMPSALKSYVEILCSLPLWVLLAIVFYNVFLVLVCAFFGFKTRKLPDNYNESWFIFLSVATTVFLWIAFLPTYFSAYLASFKVMLLALVSILNATVMLLCLFVPKIYAILFVDGEKIKYASNTTTTTQVAPAN